MGNRYITQALGSISRLTFRIKLFFAFSFIVAIYTLFLIFYLPFKLEQEQLKQVVNKAKSITHMTATSISAAVDFNDIKGVDELLAGTLSNPDIEYLIIYNSKSEILFKKNIALANKYKYSIISDDEVTFDGKIYMIKSPINWHNNIIGEVFIGFSLKEIRAEINEGQKSVLILALILLIIGLISAYFISSYFIKPLKIMGQVFFQIANDDLTRRVDIENRDEIGDLANSFNLMVDKLEKAYEMKYMNMFLEQKVEEQERIQDDLIRTQNELNQMLEKEKELGELKSRFISMVSHEIRTPLTSIMNSTYIISTYNQEIDCIHIEYYNSKIRVFVADIIRLLENVLVFGHQKSNIQQLNITNFDIIYFIESNINNIKKLNNVKHEIMIEYCKDNIIISTDQQLLNQIIINLIDNSIKYSHVNSKIVVKLEENGDYVNIQISDSGIGIPEKDLKYLFEPFIRASNVNNVPGTGLGLSIVKELVTTLKGSIKVESKVNVGTTFTLEFPLNSSAIIAILN